jgi:Cu2+-exporting ATPase
MAVSETIAGSGLLGYYQNRDLPAIKPDESSAGTDDYSGFDHASVQTGWVVNNNDNSSEASFLIIGINCAACVWLIETYLGGIAGIQSAQINFSSNLMKVSWDPQSVKVSAILQAVSRIGYQAQPYTREARYRLLDQQRGQLLKRLGISAALGMQVMVISVALYSGDWFGIDTDIASFLKRVGLLLVLPILVYSARPFFQGAVRSLRVGRAGMDVPISLGISLAFLASFWAVVDNNGEVYFDSIAMFVFFILGARYIELTTRIQGSRAMESLTAAIPAIASRLIHNGIEKVPVAELQVSDLVLINPGSVIPADGQIVEGLSSFNESLLSGESLPVLKKVGESVIAGSINIDQPVTVRVTQTGEQTVLSSIQQLADNAALDKPRVTQFAESIAGWFIAAVLLIALISLLWGIFGDNPDWLPRTIALLVVSCPCALSLATPLALSAGSNSINASGIFVARQHALETLARVDHVVFDKTGTLTNGELGLVQIRTFSRLDSDQCTTIAAALESQSDHPVARSIIQRARKLPVPPAREVHHSAGAGVSGEIENQSYFMGSAEFVHQQLIQSGLDSNLLKDSSELDKIIVYLADEHQLLAAFVFSDEIKPGALELIDYLHREGIRTSLLSGDRLQLVEHVAQQLGIETAHAECRPEQKKAVLEQLIEHGDIVAMVGDGINDAPALNLAHLSIAIARDINITSVNADMVMMNRHIEEIETAIVQARRSRRIIRQNVVWAVLYNFTAIPLALVGLVPPWLAAIGMSLSSVVVVLNSSRLLRLPGTTKTGK